MPRHRGVTKQTEPFDETKWIRVNRVWHDGAMRPFKPTDSCMALYLNKEARSICRKILGVYNVIDIDFSYLDPDVSVQIDVDGETKRFQSPLHRLMWVNARPEIERIEGHITVKNGDVNDWRVENLLETKHRRGLSIDRVNFIQEDLKTMSDAGFDYTGDPETFSDEVLDKFPMRLKSFLKYVRKGSMNANKAKKRRVMEKIEENEIQPPIVGVKVDNIALEKYIVVKRAQIGEKVYDFISTKECTTFLISKHGTDLISIDRDGVNTSLQPVITKEYRILVTLNLLDRERLAMFTESVDLLQLIWLNANPDLPMIDRIIYSGDAGPLNWSLANLSYLTREEIMELVSQEKIVLVDIETEADVEFSCRRELQTWLVEKELCPDTNSAKIAVNELLTGKRKTINKRVFLKPTL